MKWVPASPEFLRNCCKNELQGTTQSRHICLGQEPYRRGALSAGAHPRPLSTPTEHRASNACQSQGAWRQLMRVSVQIRPLSFNASFFPHFTQKCSRKISKPGKVEIEYREIERKPSISPHFYCRFPTWSTLETPDKITSGRTLVIYELRLFFNFLFKVTVALSITKKQAEESWDLP